MTSIYKKMSLERTWAESLTSTLLIAFISLLQPRPIAYVGLNLALAFLFYDIFVIWHELGHFIAAFLLRLPIKEVSIGRGPLLMARKLGKISFSLRKMAGGHVKVSLSLRALRYRALFALGGPLIDFVLLAVLISIVNGGVGAVVYPQKVLFTIVPYTALAWTQLIRILLNLAPTKGSDGWTIWKSFGSLFKRPQIPEIQLPQILEENPDVFLANLDGKIKLVGANDTLKRMSEDYVTMLLSERRQSDASRVAQRALVWFPQSEYLKKYS